ncbi:MAG TPA: SDR family NAD(P)-dependent oxidoreductase, partial [Thiothrix sp.]|nr:SDR family NAD(P)-dependent oxidoreductase [Thiothrix sp.]
KQRVLKHLQDITPCTAKIPFASTVTGTLENGKQLNNQYWWDNIRQPVLFGKAINNLLDEGFNCFLEVGPHPIMRGYINESLRARDITGMVIPTIQKEQESIEAIKSAAYSTYLAGCRFNASHLLGKKTSYTPLPHYPWQHERHWYPLTSEGYDLVSRKREHPLLGYRLKDAEAQWENIIDTTLFPYLADHVVDGGVILPAAAYIEIALAAAKSWFNQDDINKANYEIENIDIHTPIVLDHTKVVHFNLLPDDGSFKISSRDRLSDDPWTLNIVGRLMGNTARKPAEAVDINNIKTTSQHTITREEHYQLTAAVGLDYGAGFQGIEQVWINTKQQQATAQLRIDDSISTNFKHYILHPSLLDAGFQLLVDVFSTAIDSGKQTALIPVQIGKLYHYHSTDVLNYLQVIVKKQSPQSVVADFILYNQQGECLAELRDCRFRAMQLNRNQHITPSRYTFQAQLMPLYATPEAAPITSLTAIKTAVLEYFSSQDNRTRQRHYDDILPLLDAASSMFAWQALKQFKQCHTPFTTKQLCTEEQIDSTYLPLLQRMLSILEQDELASQTNDGQWTLAISADLPDANAIWLAILGDSSTYIAELIMLGRCGMHLHEVLQGTLQADELLFPTKSSIKSHWYTASPSYTTINNGLGESIRHLVNHWPDNKRIRILQIGNGDTSLTQQLLPLLPPEQTDYLFSDKNSDVLSKVNFELADYTFLTTAVLDIETSLTEQLTQQLAYHRYDIVIAANTLHRCHHLDNALKNITQLLAPKGLLLLLENQPDRFTDLTFGIDPTWWIHSDNGNKEKEQATSSLLTTTAWQQHLADTGFNNTAVLQEPAAIEGVGTFMIIAESPAFISNNQQSQQQPEQTISSSSIKQPSWLIFHDNNTLELAYTLQSALQEKQQDVSLIETLSLQATSVDNIIHLAGLNDNNNDNNNANTDTRISTSTILALQEKRCLSTIKLAQQLEKNQTECTLWFITRNAAVIDQTNSSFNFNNTPEQATLWGLGRVLMNEHPTLQSFMIDLQDQKDQADTNIQSHQLVAEFLNANPSENEIILSKNARHVMRMRKKDLQPLSQSTVSQPHFCLEFKTPGPLKHLYWKALLPRSLKANEIEIHPLATGLNFRDVMYAMGLLSDEAVENGFAGPTLGMELAGTVVQVGADVNNFSIGDAVIGFAPACFSSRVITETTAVAHKPEAWDYQEAATVPTTFFTVYYALHHLAHLEEGDKILIHGAAGGVGIAAIQYARYCGAEIFATAGSDEKRDFVRLMGADHILDSRSLNYADDIMAITKGEGIDIVLNSLAGEAINRNLAILKPFGRFLELGKRDFYENSKIGLRPFRNNISYFGIDADQLLIQRPALANRLFKEMMGLFNEGILRPLPYRTFPATHIEDAFRYMQQSKQIGKVIVSFEDQAIINTLIVETETPTQKALQCDANGSYLVTGGLSGFGLKTAQWLVEKGAQHLILLSRGGKANDEAAKHIATLREKDISVTTHACDVTDKKALHQLINQIPTQKPLKGIIHAAMVLDDGLIRNMQTEQFNTVIAPKVSGAWHLHTLTEHLNLDFFVLYSSATTFMGNPGQANYVSANMFLESLAHYRHAKQLPATYAAWGAIDDVGFLARNEKTKAALQSRLGGKPLHSNHALAMLEKLIVNQHIGAAIIDFDWNTIQRLMPSARSNKYEEQLRQCSSASEQTEDIHTLLADKSTAEAQALISTMLMDEIAQILRIPTEKLDTTSSIFDLGMDSLMGMELVLAIEERFNVKLPVMALTEGANIKRIAERISEQLIGNDIEENNKTDNINLVASQHGQTLSEKDAKKLSAAVENNKQ